MIRSEQSRLIARLFTDRARMDEVIRRSHASVLKRHAASRAPVVIWRNGSVERIYVKPPEDG